MNSKINMPALIVALMLLSIVWTTQASADIGSMNALDALGIDTSKLPEGYDPHTQDNPYGRDNITLNPVYELFVTEVIETEIDEDTIERHLQHTLYGHNKSLNQSMAHFYDSQGKTLEVYPVFEPLVATSSASGNFIGQSAAALGRFGQVVTVGAGDWDENGGLYLYFTDAVTGEISSNLMTLIDTDRIIGNTGQEMDEDFVQSPYLMQNYLQIATGDFDNSGIDEIAVYIPEQGNSRVEIYKLHTTAHADEDFYLDVGNWKKEWTFYFNEDPYLSNMVSLTTGDFNRNGIDDLVVTWGYYYGPGENSGCQAVVMFGHNSQMLRQWQTITLEHDTAGIVRAAFTKGDINGDGIEELILGGQLATDIAAGNLNSRFIGIYSYDGVNDRFIVSQAKNFDLFEKEDGHYVYTAMANHSDRYYSVPAAPANIATVNMGGVGQASYIYLDSILYEFGDDGLDILLALDNNNDFNYHLGSVQAFYVEYGVTAADFTGDCRETIQVMQYYVSVLETIPIYLDWWWRILIGEIEIEHPGQLNMVAVYGNADGIDVNRTSDIEFSTSFCKLNTDEDTALLRYTGTHYITYTDPKVLAVLASPPYFTDLSSDYLSGEYMSSETSYSEMTGEGEGDMHSHTLNVGAYMSFEKDVKIFGVTVFSWEAEISYSCGLTWETTNRSMLEQTISYSTPAGTDSVAFYSIPMEVYVYESLVPIIDEDTGEITGYDEQLMTVNIPHTAAVQVLPLDTYERIAADYEELPQISGSVLTHTVGDPSTYPSTTSGFNNAIAYSGDWSMVGYGGGSIEQEIEMTYEEEDSFTHTHSIDAKIGAGAGGFIFGITAGYEYGSGQVTVSTSGNSFSGQLYNMPIEAEPYGYSHKWKIFSYEYSSSSMSFPVVSYLVHEVIAPPALPSDFQQDAERTTDDQNALTWSYRGNVAGFQLYRYYEFPDGSGSYEIAFVKASDIVDADSDGARYYEFMDTGLYSYTDYTYQIQVVGPTPPTESILSEVATFRTKTDVGYPETALLGPDNGVLRVYPDTDSTVGVIINNSEDYTQAPRYQWQKLSPEGWSNMAGATGQGYTFRTAGLSDEGLYRCRVNVIYEHYYISDYTESFLLEYSKRTPQVVADSFTVIDTDTGPEIEISLESAHTNHSYEPGGTVVFDVIGADYHRSFPVDLTPGAAGQSNASITLDPLDDGAYLISAYYSGSRVYKSLQTDAIPYLAGSDSGYVLTIDSNYTYGNPINPVLESLEKGSGGETISVPIEGDITYKVIEHEWVWNYIPSLGWVLIGRQEVTKEQFVLPDGSVTAALTGGYTLVAYVNGDRVATRAFSVEPRQVTIWIDNQEDMSGDPDLVHPDCTILTASPSTPLAYDDTIADLGLAVRAFNTAGTEVTIDSSTNPGHYAIIGAPGVVGDKFEHYELSYAFGTYTVTGMQYEVTGVSLPLNQISVGTIELISPEGNDNVNWTTRYSHGTGLVFLAASYTGYDVNRWTVYDDGTDQIIKTADGGDILNHQMTGEDIRVVVEFQVAQRTLTFEAEGGEGSVECSSANIDSGTVVMQGAEFTFMATPADGYHFVQWQLYEEGKSPVSPEAVIDEDGKITCEIVMGSGNTRLYAIFARDSYQISLDGDLQASYWVDPEIIGEDAELVTAYCGDSIIGDKEVTVMPKPGYVVKQEAVWYHDGEPVMADEESDNQSYTFIMLADTVIAVETENESYELSLEVVGPGSTDNEVSVAINGEHAELEDLISVAGGSALEFTANPAYGYLFSHWLVDGDIASTNHSLSISALGAELQIAAVFIDNDAYTVSVEHGLRGSLSYELNEGELTPIGSGGEIAVFCGDDVVITANPEINFMVQYWVIDGSVELTTAKTMVFSDISDDIEVEVVFGAQSYSTVMYEAVGDGTVAGTTDGVAFESGSNSVGNGSLLEFTASPGGSMMVAYWEQNGDEVLSEFGTSFVDDVHIIEALFGDTDIVVYFRDVITHSVETEGINSDIAVDFYPEFEPLSVGDDVRDGAAAVFTFTPDEGYRIIDIQVIGSQGRDGFDIVSISDGIWVGTVREVIEDLTVSAEATRLYAITVPEMPIGGSISIGVSEAIPGEVVTLNATPASGRKFDGWVLTAKDEEIVIDIADADAAATTFVMPESDVYVSAQFQVIQDDGPGPGPDPEPGPGPDPEPEPEPDPEDITVSVSEDGMAAELSVHVKDGADLDEDSMAALLELAEQLSEAGQSVVLNIVIDSDDDAATLGIASEALSQLTDVGAVDVVVTSGIGSMHFDSDSVESMLGAAGDDSVLIGIAKADRSLLSEQALQNVGDRPVYDFTVRSGMSSITEFGGYVTIRIPYTLQPDEDPNAVVVYYIDDEGNVKTMRGVYDADTQTVVCRTTHLSVFAVGYNEVSFVDVASDAWYHDAITFMAARDIVRGIGAGAFNPSGLVTRADFLIMVMNSYGIDVDPAITDNFADGGHRYYSPYLATARHLGLVTGVGDNLYLPTETISRQDMLVILYRILEQMDELPTGEGELRLADFVDADEIAGYAREALELFVDTDTVRGDGVRLAPRDTSSRAEAVQVLYNLLADM